jgi:NAD(P)H-flavin reductase
MNNPYIPLVAKVKMARFESPDRSLKTVDLVLDSGKFDFVPGQFCEISIFGKGEAPFGIASAPSEDFLRFTINKTGFVTGAIHWLEEGDEVGIRGPLGNSYPVEKFAGKNVVIVSGGFAFTTLRSLIIHLLEHRSDYGDISVVYGAREPGLLLYRDEIQEWQKRDDIKIYLTIDTPAEGWDGYVGFVPTVLGEVKPSSTDAYLVMCGPPAMIKFTLPVIKGLDFPPEKVYTSIERRMKCGIGKCGRCNVGPYFVCRDGPVFTMAELESLPKEY